MRFSEVFDNKDTDKILEMGETEFAVKINEWAKAMGKRVGYKKQTRLEHWQEAINKVYTALEKKLGDDEDAIFKTDKWKIMVTAAANHFPEHISVYHPTVTERQRIHRLIKNTRITRQLKDKSALMKILKTDKDLTVTTLEELAVSRLQCELLASSAERLVAEYHLGSAVKNSAQASKTTDVSGSREGSVGLKAPHATGAVHGAAQVGGKASYSSGSVPLGHGFSHSVETAIQASAGVEGYAEGKARVSDLASSASAGLEGAAQISADVDYHLEHTCRVTVGALRRKLGPEFKAFAFEAGAVATGRVGGSLNASAQAFQGAGFEHIQDRSSWDRDTTKVYDATERTDEQKEKEFDRNQAKFNLLNASADAELELAVRLTGKAGITVGQTFGAEVTGDIFAGGQAAGNVSFAINDKGVGLNMGAKLFAGFEVGSQQKLKLKHPTRPIEIFTVHFGESFSTGIGIEAAAKARAGVGGCYFDTRAGATLGVGTSISIGSVVSTRGVLLLGYDMLAGPAVKALGSTAGRISPGCSVEKMMGSAYVALNEQASKAEVNQVYETCQGKISACLGAMAAEGTKLSSMTKFRTPGYATTAMTKEERLESLQSALSLIGSEEGSKYYETKYVNQSSRQAKFGENPSAGLDNYSGPMTSLDKTSAAPIGNGKRGSLVDVNDFGPETTRKDSVVNDAKANLHSTVTAYRTAKHLTAGNYVAYRVLREDLLKGNVNYK
ncbi:hypothetical protein [Parendozoicomonas sp. Alg238-R29]|uniref:hypothetical protein n=1 Tax=Parendozoicomonas sp. Alg238-R29 TaxID=2993446 RepID=UPI00248DE789|nr:hypothetical protein [Parendozoicomonas sp. Alg238-R29]